VVLLAAAVTLLFPSEEARELTLYSLGDVADEDVVAEVPFDVPRDSAELAGAQAAAAAAEPPVFTRDPGARERVEGELNNFFDEIQRASEAGGGPAVERVLEQQGLSAQQADFYLDDANLRNLRQGTLDVVRRFSDRYLISDYDGTVEEAGQIVVWTPEGEYFLGADSLLWGTEFLNEATRSLGTRSPQFQSNLRSLLNQFFGSPYDLDPIRTDTRRAAARGAVNPIEKRVLRNEAIVRRNQQIGSSELRSLNAHRNALEAEGLVREPGRNWGPVVGDFLLNLLFLGIFGLLLYFFRKEVYGAFRWVLLLTLLALVYVLLAWGIIWQEYPWELLPMAFVILPVAILWDGRMALILALVLSVLTYAQEPFNFFPVLAFSVVGGAVAALSARAVRRRSQTWIFIALITLGYALALTALGFRDQGDPGAVATSIFFAGINATISAILAMGFMPVFEWLTGITTDQTLLEWADPNRPLLKSLSLEASGTYAHTINVANLAEAAATAIGANGLLVRVGIYYHDVGKMLKPQYFVENQPGGSRNPHDKLKPHTSAEIVKEHVLEGERMAREKGVPDVIARFIPEHHGTQLIGFFYDKAREESDTEPDPEEFRYPGPKPQSKETAIAMLADSVESATRVLQNPSPERVRELVKTIVDGKVQDGQLSESPLTLRELTQIQEQFVKVVSGMFHHRLDYPATRHVTGDHEAQVKAPPKVKPGPGKGATGEQLDLAGDDEDAPPTDSTDGSQGP